MAEEIRPLGADDIDLYWDLTAQAFQIPAADMESLRRQPLPVGARGLFVEGELRAGLRVLDLQMWLGAAPVRVAGLSGVLTPPEFRRQGYIARLLDAHLAEMREAGYTLSALYPFYFPFYKRYGWAHVSDNVRYSLPIERLPPATGPAGTWHLVRRATDRPPAEGQEAVAEADLAVLMDIYAAWTRGRSGALVRDRAWWREHRLPRPANIYYWRDPAGTPRAYVIYTFKETGDWERQLQVRELVANGPAALAATLGFLRNHDSQAGEVTLWTGEDRRLLALLDDPRLKVEVEPGFMLRLLDVPGALAARAYPAGAAGHLVLQVGGSGAAIAPVYRLEVEAGVGRAAPAAADPDLSLDVRTLTQLYSGYLTPCEAADLGLLQVHAPAALARAAALFAGPRPFMPDFF